VLLAELIAEGLGQHLEVLCVATVAEGVELLMGGRRCGAARLHRARGNDVADRAGGRPAERAGCPHDGQSRTDEERGIRHTALHPPALSDLKRVQEQAARQGGGGNTPPFVDRSA
jgi:hypothetical protein